MPRSISADVSLNLLALLLERLAEQACADTWRNIRKDLEPIKAAQLLSPNGNGQQMTEASAQAANLVKSRNINF